MVTEIKCECGKKDCDKGLLISECAEDKLKIRLFDSKDIGSVVVDKKKLKEVLK